MSATAALAPGMRSAEPDDVLDLSGCTILVPDDASRRETKYAAVLSEEVQKRSQLKWQVRTFRENVTGPVIYLSTSRSVRQLERRSRVIGIARASLSSEGFTIAMGVSDGKPWVAVLGADERGCSNKPSATNWPSASRTGVRLLPSSWARGISETG